MRESIKSTVSAREGKDIFGVNFHRFLQVEDDFGGIEMAQEFGISLGDIKKLRDKSNRA